MTALAPILRVVLHRTTHRQRHASPHTVAAYRDTFRLLLAYAHTQTGKQPSQLDLADLDAGLIAAFLDHLEHERGNTRADPQRPPRGDPLAVPLRRLRQPEHAAADPARPRDPRQAAHQPVVSFLAPAEVDALLAAPGPRTRGSAGAITPCSSSRSRPGCASPSSSRAALRRRRARHRRPRALLRQRPQAALHATHPTHHQRVARLARRTRGYSGDQPLFPTRRGRSARAGRRRRPRRPTRRHRPSALPLAGHQEVHPTRCATPPR